MNLSDVLGVFLGKKKEQKEYFISLCLDTEHVAISVWTMSEDSIPHTLSHGSRTIQNNTWKERIEATDSLLAQLEEQTGVENLSKVIFGLPQQFLSKEGDISHENRIEIKKLSHMLELEPVGFVPIHQALVFTLKKEEGIPPSIILLGISRDSIIVSIYKVGSLVGTKIVVKQKHIALAVEEALKEFQQVEVLPARIILYGSETIEEIKNDLLNYPWPTRVNFIHFPKIETFGPKRILEAISLAGSSEIVGNQLVKQQDNNSTDSLEDDAAHMSQA